MIADLPVTLTFISLCALALFALTAWVGFARAPQMILRGDGGDPLLEKRIRIHGNFIENAPIAALAIGGAEWLGLTSQWLWAALLSFALGRVLHFALYDSKVRGGAMLLTQLPAAALGAWILTRLWF